MPNENPVVIFINKMTDIIILNLLFLVCCIPVITIGPALTAMYSVNLRSIRYGDGYVVSTFFKSFKQNFRQSFVAGLIAIAASVLLLLDLYFWSQVPLGMLSEIMMVVSLCIAFLIFIVLLWLFPVIAKIENSFMANVKNAAAMAAGHFFPYTFACCVITFAAAYLTYTSVVVDVLMALLGFSLLSYVQSFFFYKVFAKYMDEEPVGDDDPLYGEHAKRLENEK